MRTLPLIINSKAQEWLCWTHGSTQLQNTRSCCWTHSQMESEVRHRKWWGDGNNTGNTKQLYRAESTYNLLLPRHCNQKSSIQLVHTAKPATTAWNWSGMKWDWRRVTTGPKIYEKVTPYNFGKSYVSFEIYAKAHGGNIKTTVMLISTVLSARITTYPTMWSMHTIKLGEQKTILGSLW